MYRSLVAFLFLVGCDGGETVKLGDDSGVVSDDDTGKTDDSAVEECKATLVSFTPDDGATDVSLAPDISFTLSEADDTAKITTDIPGSQTVLDDGVTVVWTLDGALDSKQSYSVDFSWCGGTQSLSFTTQEGFADKVENKAYALELQKASIDQPPGVGGLLGNQLPEYILMQVMQADGATITFMGAMADPNSNTPEQDVCMETIPFPTADFSAQPDFAVGPQDTTISVSGVTVTLFAMELTGTFSADGSSIQDGTLAGSVDAREVADSVGYDAGTICQLLSAFGAACAACPTDGQAYCIALEASKLEGDLVSGLSLVEVTNPTCFQ